MDKTMDEQEALLKELKLQNKKLTRENGRLQTEISLLQEVNEKVSRTQEFFQRDNQRQLCYNSQLLKTSPYIVLMVNEKLETVMASDVYFRMTDVSRDAIKEGMPLSEAFSGILEEEERNDFLEHCRGVLTSQGTDSYLLSTFANGEERFYQVEICYYLEQSVDVEGLSIIFSDTTEIMEAKKKAENADRAKSSFLASMSHEIRTPINAVLGMNEMILRETKDPAILEYASNIQTAGRTLLSLINSILDFSKIEEGKMEIVPVSYDTASVLNNLVVSVSERARQKGLELKVEIDPLLPATMVGDDVRVSQVALNLLTNAVKYTEKGTVTFSVQGEKKGDGEIVLKFAVKDTGIGIRKEDIPKLFEIFERLDEVRNHSIEGTGLGISIVTKLLKMMGSELKVESVYGEGSCFSFEILQKIEDDTPIGDYSLRLETSRSTEFTETLLAPESRILVVDDNEMNLKVAKNLFRLFDITPDLVESGKAALERLQDGETYHIIFLDHMMPEMDGIETLNCMKENNLLSENTYVIALTANAVNGAKERYLSAGFDSYLSKPIDVSKLEQKLIHYLPKEICSFRDAEEAEKEKEAAREKEAEEDSGIKKLSLYGFDTASGLRYAAGDEDFYIDLATGFAKGCDTLLPILRSDLENGDLADYQIRVHALKSTARQIGANELSDMALAQELAAKDRDAAAVQAGSDALFLKYEEVCHQVNEAFQQDQEADMEELSSLSAEEIRGLLSQAMEKIRDFEAESAEKIIKPLSELPAGALSKDISEPLKEIIAALSDFDTMTAEEKLEALLSDF